MRVFEKTSVAGTFSSLKLRISEGENAISLSCPRNGKCYEQSSSVATAIFVVFKSNFLKNDRYLSFSLHYFEYILKSVVDSCILNDAEWTLPHSVRCLYNGMSSPVNGEKNYKVLLFQRLFSTNSLGQGRWEADISSVI